MQALRSLNFFITFPSFPAQTARAVPRLRASRIRSDLESNGSFPKCPKRSTVNTSRWRARELLFPRTTLFRPGHGLYRSHVISCPCLGRPRQWPLLALGSTSGAGGKVFKEPMNRRNGGPS
jgi:hypothetical protein